jgi:uncharacterized membrane protein YphA (DoxX/SURF4 family)
VRIFLGFLVAACALAAAVYMHHGWTHSVKLYEVGNAHAQERYSWQNAAAVFVAVAGVGAGIAIALPAFRRLAQP